MQSPHVQMARFVPLRQMHFFQSKPQERRETVRRKRQEGEQTARSDSPTGAHYEIIDSVELARRWVLSASWVRDHVRSRTTDPIPHIRFGRYVRFRWGSPELEGWLAEHMVNSSASGSRGR
jgi:hypothetical protein